MSINRIGKWFLLTAVVLVLVGCASIVDGRKKQVRINSQPSGATVTVTAYDGSVLLTNQTPAVLRLERSRGYFQPTKYRVEISLPGYKTAEVRVESRINGWYFGNIVFGGLIGFLIVDPATGAMWTLSPKAVDQVLEAGTAGVPRAADGLVVLLRQDVAEEWAGELQPLGTGGVLSR